MVQANGWFGDRVMRIGFVAAMMAIVALAWAAPAAAGIVVTVDKSAQRMKVVVDGVEKYDWPVSTGAKDYVTPSGTFSAFRLEKDHKSQEWDNAPMPYSVFFTHQGHAIHGSNSRMGVPLSRGCVRLQPKNAETFFNLVQKRGVFSTRVVIVDRAPVVTASTRKVTPVNNKSGGGKTGSGKGKKSKPFVSPFYMDRWQP